MHDASAEGLPDRLMSKADPEDRDVGTCLADEIERDAGFVRRAWSGRHDDRLGRERQNLVDAHLVVTHDLDRAHERPDQMDEIPGEGIVVVEDEEGSHGGPQRRRDVPSTGSTDEGEVKER